MTNDDRSNEDRTGDGQVPSWGDAPQQPAAGAAPAGDAPRYGERVDPAPTSTPQYGEQAAQGEAPRYGSTEYAEQQGQYGRPDDAQPQYGQQQQYGQQPYAAAAAAPASAGAPSWQGYEEPKRKKKTVGVVALIVALVALALAVVAGIVFGSAFGGSSAIRDSLLDGSAATESGQQDLQQQLMNDPSLVTSSGGAGIAILAGTVLGLWAIVQGIIAIVTKRGRAFGVIALIVAVVAPIVLYIVFAVVLGTQLA
ncbi:tripartite tricarboxylate transporter TctB family protein [Curtobacterium pusillum]|uniref:tripartite tricarboxylate transporter TctB family protein n=1 Tax=Curtobacterium pusillum TaxID=69373 RepID=UPI00380A0AFE